MPDALTCADCGAAFIPRQELLDRFPGWTPRTCPSCYRSSSTRGGGGQGRPTRRRAATQATLEAPEGSDEGLFTDGSSVPNPGPGGWGAVYVVDGAIVDEAHGHEPGTTTNNRMELTALARGIELVPAGTACTVWSDSSLAVRTLTEWAAGWRSRGWKRRTGPVENLDLVAPLFEALEARPELELRWIKAHVGHRWNEHADELASRWMRDGAAG